MRITSVLVFIIIVLLGILLTRTTSEVSFLAGHPEYQYKELAGFFQKLATTKGPVFAFDVLRDAKLPPNTDIHLLGHTIGDVLYKQKAASGMGYCTQDFRNACSHAIVVGLFTDYGEQALDMIAQACYKAPGGKGAYTMCFHGLGHGMLAYYGYDLKKTIESCQKTATLQFENRESIECVGGAVMEITGGGFHDRELWSRQRAIYLSKDDPLAPCDRPLIPDDAKHMCYLYLTFNIINPLEEQYPTLTESDIIKAFVGCDKIPRGETLNRDYCFGGISKEFLIIVLARDFRGVASLTDDNLRRWYELCALSPVPDGVISCIRHSVNTFYWGGENTVKVPVNFCRLIDDAHQKNICFTHVVGAVKTYAQDQRAIESLCRLLPEQYRFLCNE